MNDKRGLTEAIFGVDIHERIRVWDDENCWYLDV